MDHIICSQMLTNIVFLFAVLADLLGPEMFTNSFGLLLLFQGVATLGGPPVVGKKEGSVATLGDPPEGR